MSMAPLYVSTHQSLVFYPYPIHLHRLNLSELLLLLGIQSLGWSEWWSEFRSKLRLLRGQTTEGWHQAGSPNCKLWESLVLSSSAMSPRDVARSSLSCYAHGILWPNISPLCTDTSLRIERWMRGNCLRQLLDLLLKCPLHQMPKLSPFIESLGSLEIAWQHESWQRFLWYLIGILRFMCTLLRGSYMGVWWGLLPLNLLHGNVAETLSSIALEHWILRRCVHKSGSCNQLVRPDVTGRTETCMLSYFGWQKSAWRCLGNCCAPNDLSICWHTMLL